jgi:hypothetical protein
MKEIMNESENRNVILQKNIFKRLKIRCCEASVTLQQLK